MQIYRHLSHYLFNRYMAFTFLFIAAIALAGCNTKTTIITTEPAALQTTTPTMVDQANTQPIPVVRYGRYTLVEIEPTLIQQEPLQQIIDVVIPDKLGKPTTVSDAIRYVLKRSGYQLCKSDVVAQFDKHQLPLVQTHLGPIRLSHALQVLAGPAYKTVVDNTTRQVCFEPLNKQGGI